MYMRLVHIEVREGALPYLRELYSTRIIPALQGVTGCRYAGLTQSIHHPEQCISLTVWNSEADAQAYEKEGVFQNLMAEAQPYLSESSEFKIQLSENLTLEYIPVPNEPVVEAFPIAVRSLLPDIADGQPDALWLRIVSLKILPGKMEEFSRLYREHAIPALRSVKGCRFVYLLESKTRDHEVLSVTSWDSRKDAERYEQNGLFEQLLEKQKHTLSGLYQWKRSLGKDLASRSATSEDVLVEHYAVLTAKNFT